MADDSNPFDGGLAHPATRREPDPANPAFWHSVTYPGLTLRDWFAGQALAGILANPNQSATFESDASAAWKAADALLAFHPARKPAND